MLLFSLTDLADLVWNKSMGLSTELTDLAIDVTLIMCLMPAIIIYRNYYHGRLMMERKTGGMAYASIIRVIGIFAAAQALFALQWLNHSQRRVRVDSRLCYRGLLRSPCGAWGEKAN